MITWENETADSRSAIFKSTKFIILFRDNNNKVIKLQNLK